MWATQGAATGSGALGGSAAAAAQRVRSAAGPDVLNERPAARLPPLAQEEALCECEEDGNLRFQLLRTERWEPGSVTAATSLPLIKKYSTREKELAHETNAPVLSGGSSIASLLELPKNVSVIGLATPGSTIAIGGGVEPY